MCCICAKRSKFSLWKLEREVNSVAGWGGGDIHSLQLGNEELYHKLNIYVCIYVCIYICIYVCIYVYMYVCILVVGRLIVNSIARLALGRVPINRTCRPSLDLCRAIIKINTTRRPPSWKIRAIGRIHCNSLLEWITVYNLTEPAELVSYKVYMILFYSMHYIDTLFQVEIDG